MNKVFRLAVRQNTFIREWISAKLNAWALKKALKVGYELCASKQYRFYVLEINNHYVIESGRNIAKENKKFDKFGKASIDKLLVTAIAIFDYDKFSNRVKRTL